MLLCTFITQKVLVVGLNPKGTILGLTIGKTTKELSRIVVRLIAAIKMWLVHTSKRHMDRTTAHISFRCVIPATKEVTYSMSQIMPYYRYLVISNHVYSAEIAEMSQDDKSIFDIFVLSSFSPFGEVHKNKVQCAIGLCF